MFETDIRYSREFTAIGSDNKNYQVLEYKKYTCVGADSGHKMWEFTCNIYELKNGQEIIEMDGKLIISNTGVTLSEMKQK